MNIKINPFLIPFLLIMLIPALLTFIMKRENIKRVSDTGIVINSKTHIPGVDHSKFQLLSAKFEFPQEVTMACLSCHTERHKEVMQSSHWRWERAMYIKNRGVAYFGKKNVINNYCIGIGGSEQSCTRCHTGYGWEDNSYDFEDYRNIDCLVCHDNSGEYVKGGGMAGYPAPYVDLALVAQNVGLPKMNNCGTCHFFGGGGNNVKHGDLEKALLSCDRNVDVHLATNGENMECTDCHTAKNHKMKGKMYSVSSMNRDRVTCEDCHNDNPHEKNLLNEHTIKVDCKTCHIPVYAKENATKLTWDWSKAGRLDKNGEPLEIEDEDGNHTYLSIKGEFTWGKNVKPEYVWFNGTADHYLIGDKVDTTGAIKINTLNGDYQDRDARIIPVKVHRSKQIYDCKQKMIIQPKLYAEKKGEGAYWKDFDWDLAAKLGMKSVGQDYSGSFCFVRTEMYWPINHMVSPKEETLSCKECHSRKNSRLAELTDFYMPGRNRNATIDLIGIFLIFGSALGVFVHAGLRVFSYRKIGHQNK